MHNIWLIAKREYTERIKTKGFLIATILIPLLMGGGLFGVATLAAKSKTTSHIAVLTSQFAGAWLDFVLRKGWPLLKPAATTESAPASSEGVSAA